MTNKKKMKKIFLGCLILSFIFSCKKKNEEILIQETNESVKVLDYIKSLGFPSSRIVDVGKEYIVEGDISFPKDMVVPSKGDPTTEQYYSGSRVSFANQSDIKIFVDPSMSSMLNEINAAINQWNEVPNSNLHFRIVTSVNYNILIRNESGVSYCGLGRFPKDGSPGGLIKINMFEIATNSFDQRQRTIAHEIGHCVGFRHTNWQEVNEPQQGVDEVGTSGSAIDVPGVGGVDPNSLMNAGQCGFGASIFSEKDRLAISALYPNCSNAPSAPTITATLISGSGEPTEYLYTAPFSSNYQYNWYVNGVFRETTVVNTFELYIPYNVTSAVTCTITSPCGTSNSSNSISKTGRYR